MESNKKIQLIETITLTTALLLTNLLTASPGNAQDAEADRLKARWTYRMYDISEFMKTLLQRLSQSYNTRHERKGTLWLGRFKSLLVQGSQFALSAVAAYIDLNAVRAGLVADPKDYRFCGYGEAMGGLKPARKGLWQVIAHGAKLPLRTESWYWYPTRIIPSETGNPIAEFPAFTFLYGDLHAHMIAFSLTLLALTLAVYWVRDSHPRWSSILIGGLVIGALWPANTWDYPTYLANGWPIASGVIEGACRHFVKDRFELSGMRWNQQGAENLLRLRAVAENDDWDAYHIFRKQQRHVRLYNSPFSNQVVLEVQALNRVPFVDTQPVNSARQATLEHNPGNSDSRQSHYELPLAV